MSQVLLRQICPSEDALAVTLDADLDVTADGIYVGGDGDISVVTPKGNTVVLSSAVAGSVLPVRHTRINTSGTTATNLVHLF